MIGKEVHLPMNLAFGISIDRMSASAHRSYVDRLCKNLKTVYEKAQEASDARGKARKVMI